MPMKAEQVGGIQRLEGKGVRGVGKNVEITRSLVRLITLKAEILALGLDKCQ